MEVSKKKEKEAKRKNNLCQFNSLRSRKSILIKRLTYKSISKLGVVCPPPRPPDIGNKKTIMVYVKA